MLYQLDRESAICWRIWKTDQKIYVKKITEKMCIGPKNEAQNTQTAFSFQMCRNLPTYGEYIDLERLLNLIFRGSILGFATQSLN